MSPEVFDRAVIAHNIIFTTVRATHNRRRSRKLGRRNGAIYEIEAKAEAVTHIRAPPTATSMVSVLDDREGRGKQEAGERGGEVHVSHYPSFRQSNANDVENVDVDNETESRAFEVTDIT